MANKSVDSKRMDEEENWNETKRTKKEKKKELKFFKSVDKSVAVNKIKGIRELKRKKVFKISYKYLINS